MHSEIDSLNKVHKDLSDGRTATPVTIRDFVSWFGAQRRTKWNVEYINAELDKVGIRTVPDYENIWVDTPITFEFIADHIKEDVSEKSRSQSGDEHMASAESFIDTPDDPSYTIGKLVAANRPPISVKPNASLQEVVTRLITHNYSQIPVMTTEREVKGIVTWASIGARTAAGLSGLEAQHYMDEHHEIGINSSLFSALRIISEANYVLVRAQDRRITGIVTSSDISQHFEQISTPFLLLSEIENHLRRLIKRKLTLDDIKLSCNEEYLSSNFASVDDLTFGNYVRIFENIHSWSKLGLKLDRATFCLELMQINTIRNDVMHFDPDPLKNEDLVKLKDLSRMLNLFSNMGAF